MCTIRAFRQVFLPLSSGDSDTILSVNVNVPCKLQLSVTFLFMACYSICLSVILMKSGAALVRKELSTFKTVINFQNQNFRGIF
jgi:hypothetical protein